MIRKGTNIADLLNVKQRQSQVKLGKMRTIPIIIIAQEKTSNAAKLFLQLKTQKSPLPYGKRVCML
ncbi:MAG TPA: hypothetical protein DCM44_16960 [Pantoea sp.]|nr:hypothetical protein [Pantoea sp.]